MASVFGCGMSKLGKNSGVFANRVLVEVDGEEKWSYSIRRSLFWGFITTKSVAWVEASLLCVCLKVVIVHLLLTFMEY